MEINSINRDLNLLYFYLKLLNRENKLKDSLIDRQTQKIVNKYQLCY